jgi:HEAT repeat protein
MKFPITWSALRQTSTPMGAAGTEPFRDGGGNRNWSVRMRALIVLAAICGAALLAARVVRDHLAPVNQWVRQIRDGTVEQRVEAADELGRLRPIEITAAVPALARALGDEDERVAVVAAGSLGKAGHADGRREDSRAARHMAVTALLAALTDPRPGVRKAAAEALGAGLGIGSLGSQTTAAFTDAMATALRDQSEDVRWAAASSFVGGATTSAPPEALMAALERDSSDRVRAAAARSLGGFPSGDVALAAALQRDPADSVRAEAARALVKFPSRQAALVAALERDPSESVQAEAAQSLEQLTSGDDQTTLALLRALGTAKPAVRKVCDMSLWRLYRFRDAKGKRRSAAIVPALIEALTSRERQVRCHAAAILGDLGPEARASVPALIGVLTEAFDPESDKSVPELGDPACYAAAALGAIAPSTPQAKDAVKALISVIRNEKIDLRREMAAETVARFGAELTAPDVPVLLDLLKETAGKNGPPAPAVCIAIGLVAPATPWADKAVEALSAALDSSWANTRMRAAEALADFGSRARSALPRLRALEKTERELFVRKSAASAALRIEGASYKGTPE